jgi:hypothetical protein
MCVSPGTAISAVKKTVINPFSYSQLHGQEVSHPKLGHRMPSSTDEMPTLSNKIAHLEIKQRIQRMAQSQKIELIKREAREEKKDMLHALENEKRDRLLENERRDRKDLEQKMDHMKMEAALHVENEKRDRLLENEKRDRESEKKDLERKMEAALENEKRDRLLENEAGP